MNRNGCSINFVSASDVCSLFLYCDTLDVGFGGYFECINDKYTNIFMGSVVGDWTAEEAMQSSTWRELETVNRVIKRKVRIIRDSNLNVISDSKNVAKSYICKSLQAKYLKLALKTTLKYIKYGSPEMKTNEQIF